MTELHSTPRWSDVARAEIRATALTLRAPAIGAAAVMVLGTLLMMLNRAEPDGFYPERWLLPGLIGLLLPIGVWRGEKPFGTGFLWTLPVDRRRLAFTKVFAGWVWLMTGIAAFFVFLLAIVLITGGGVLTRETIYYLPGYDFPPHGTLSLAQLPTIAWRPEPLLWLVPFTAATATYLIASSMALGLRHPIRWFVGFFVVAFVLTGIVSEIGHSTHAQDLAFLPSRVIETLMLGRYGLDTVLAARTEAIRIDVHLADGRIVPVWRELPNVGLWARVTFAWIAAGLLLLWAAASRHRERRRA